MGYSLFQATPSENTAPGREHSKNVLLIYLCLFFLKVRYDGKILGARRGQKVGRVGVESNAQIQVSSRPHDSRAEMQHLQRPHLLTEYGGLGRVRLDASAPFQWPACHGR